MVPEPRREGYDCSSDGLEESPSPLAHRSMGDLVSAVMLQRKTQSSGKEPDGQAGRDETMMVRMCNFS